MPQLEEIQYTVEHSRRKTVSFRVNPDGTVEIRAPLRMPKREIEGMLRKRLDWVRKSQAKLREQAEAAEDAGHLSAEEIRELADRAVKVIPERVKHYAPLVGVTYGRITIRNQRSRWGSCSSMGNLNFNCLLMLAPPEVLDAIVVHELCHRLEMNHSERFYAEVLRVYPEYRKWDGWLKEHGGELLRRMTG